MTAVPKSPNRIQPRPAIRAGSRRTQRHLATGDRDAIRPGSTPRYRPRKPRQPAGQARSDATQRQLATGDRAAIRPETTAGHRPPNTLRSAGQIRSDLTQRQLSTGPRYPGRFGTRPAIRAKAATRLNFRAASQATSARNSAAQTLINPMR